MRKLKLSLAALAFIVGIGSAVVTKANTFTLEDGEWFTLIESGDPTSPSDYEHVDAAPTDCGTGSNVCAIMAPQLPSGQPDLTQIQQTKTRKNP